MDLKTMLEKVLKNENYKENNPVYHYDCLKATENKSNDKILKFYHKIPKGNEILLQKLREEARSNFLQRKSKELLGNDELKELWQILSKYHGKSAPEDALINYAEFVQVGNLVDVKCRKYFRPSVFAKLQQGDRKGRISVMCLFNYVMRKSWLHQTRMGLSLHDVTGQGYLRETDVESYILELMPSLSQLDGLEVSFHNFYVCTAVRKFMFFLDPLHTGRVRIQDILACGFLDDILELRDQESSKESQINNWFSASCALRVYGDYLNLDKDHNGMLSKQELSGYGTGTLTDVFLERVFEECLTYGGEMDYKTYLDFVLALENKQEPQALHYLFRLLDINNKGYIDTFAIKYFFKAIQQLMTNHGQEPVPFQDVQDELFDMVKPVTPGQITLKDLIECGQGDTLVSILIDLNGFWSHENREMMAAESATDVIQTD